MTTLSEKRKTTMTKRKNTSQVTKSSGDTIPSGIRPVGDRVLIRPDSLETKVGSLVIPDTVLDRHGLAQTIGTLVAVGPDAWKHSVETGPEGEVKAVKGYSQPFAKVGDKVMFAKYGGLFVRGKDDVEYRILNDVDVTALVDEEIKATDIRSREPFAQGNK